MLSNHLNVVVVVVVDLTRADERTDVEVLADDLVAYVDVLDLFLDFFLINRDLFIK